jgi:hypothetical protein
MTASSFIVDRDSISIGSGKYLDIFCQHFHGFWNKAVEHFNNVRYFAFKIMSN